MTDQPPALSVRADAARERHSPCLNVCRLDPANGLCSGCGRSGREIADWPGMSDAERLAVYDRLQGRMATIGSGARLLPWMRDDILAFLADTLARSEGAWVVGSAKGAGLVPCAALAAGEVVRSGDAVRATGPVATLSVAAHDKLRAYAIQEDGRDALIVLGLPLRRAEEIMARRRAPKRDWLVAPPVEEPVATNGGCACSAGGGCCGGAPAQSEPRETFATALATLSTSAPHAAEAIAILARAAALPSFALAMAVHDPSAVIAAG